MSKKKNFARIGNSVQCHSLLSAVTSPPIRMFVPFEQDLSWKSVFSTRQLPRLWAVQVPRGKPMHFNSGDFCQHFNCETQPPASIGWVALSSVFVCLSRIGNISSHFHYMMFPRIQTIYFQWGYDPGNMSVSTHLLLLSWAQFTVV